MLRASPVDPDLLIKQKQLLAAVLIWMKDHSVTTLSQSLAYAAHELVYHLYAMKRVGSGMNFGNSVQSLDWF